MFDHSVSERRSSLAAALGVQLNVIGALIMRELHTRFGRDNIGYLWVFAEPMLLAVAVAALHAGKKSLGASIGSVAIAICGYLTFMLFRSTVLRAESVLDGNRPLLYHRMVTLLDLLVARAILEAAAITLDFILLMGGAILLGYADPPARPLVLLAAMLLVTWFSFAVSLLVCVGAHFSRVFAIIIHPALYIALPISGAFFLMKWVPTKFQAFFEWIPLVQLEELVRFGQFRELDSTYFHPIYMIGLTMGFTLAGLLALRIVRRHIQLE
jgi:capsular polysaccharide transport system permease protein